MPCCQVFEPFLKSGHLLVSLGFSVQAEHAHQNQRRFPLKWVLGQRTSSNHVHRRGLIKFEKNQSNFNNSKVCPEGVSRFLNVNIGVKPCIQRIDSTSYRYNKKNRQNPLSIFTELSYPKPELSWKFVLKFFEGNSNDFF